MKFGVPAAILALMTPPFAHAEVYEWGIGIQSCALWQSAPAYARDGDNWIMGYWTASNIVNPKNHNVGKSTDFPGIEGEIKLVCAAHPSMSLSDAVATVYFNFQESKR